MKIYLIRHGQTLFNVKHRIQGWCDSALTDVGVAQAKALHDGLMNITIDVAYASTSERAIDTANYIIEDRDIPLYTSKGLKEMNFGTLEGEYEKDYIADDGSTHDKGFVSYGGETIEQTKVRLKQALCEIAQKHSNEHVLVVSHGGAIMCALLALFEMEVSQFRENGKHIENCSLSLIDYQDGVFTLESLSDTSYVNNGLKGA